MTDATAAFFDALVERGHEPLLEKATVTVRFDLKQGKKTDSARPSRRQLSKRLLRRPHGTLPRDTSSQARSRLCSGPSRRRPTSSDAL